MLQYLLIFVAALAGSLHCVGMCGGFACALGGDARGAAASLRRHLAYNLGRATTYCFLGTLTGYLGLLLVGHQGEVSTISTGQRILAFASGGLIVLAGLQFLGYPIARGLPFAPTTGSGLVRGLRQLLKAPGTAAPLALGALNGFLPCPLVYAFAAQAAGSGSPSSGFLIMLAFSLGTFPAMLLMGGAGLWLRGRTTAPRAMASTSGPALLLRADRKLQVLRFAGVLIIALGLVTVARGLLPMSAHLH